MKDYTIKVNKENFYEHVRRICKPNLKVPRDICAQCPFLENVLEVTEENEWYVNKKGLEEKLEKYNRKI